VLVFLRVAGIGGAKRRDLNGVLVQDHVHDPEPAADDDGAAEKRLHLFGARVGGDVVVLGRGPQQEVADRATDHVGGKPGIVQHAAYLEGGGADAIALDIVLGARDALRTGGLEAEHLADELLDHASWILS